MEKRKRAGEKIGWLGGWLGAFIWIVPLAVLFVIHYRLTDAVVGFALMLVAMAAIYLTAPWRSPDVAYWKLMIPLYLILYGSLFRAIRAYGGVAGAGLRWWNLLWVFPLLISAFTTGSRRWKDHNA